MQSLDMISTYCSSSDPLECIIYYTRILYYVIISLDNFATSFQTSQETHARASAHTHTHTHTHTTHTHTHIHTHIYIYIYIEREREREREKDENWICKIPKRRL